MDNQEPNTFVGDIVAFSYLTLHSEGLSCTLWMFVKEIGVPNRTSHPNMRVSKGLCSKTRRVNNNDGRNSRNDNKHFT